MKSMDSTMVNQVWENIAVEFLRKISWRLCLGLAVSQGLQITEQRVIGKTWKVAGKTGRRK